MGGGARRALWVLGLALALGLPACGSAPTPTPYSPPPPRLFLPQILAGDHIFVTDLATGDVAELGDQALHVSLSVHGLGLAPDGRTLFVSDIADNRLVAYPLTDGQLGQPHHAPVGVQPVHMVETPDERTVYVTNFGESSVSVVDTATWRTTGTIAVGLNPHGIAISPDGRWVYVACVGGGVIAVIDTASQRLAGTIALPPGARPYSVAVSRDGRYLYAPDNFAARLFVVDLTRRRVVATVPIGLRAALVARAADGSTLYVTNGASGTVSVLDLAADPVRPPVRATIPVGNYPHGLALTPDGRYLVVANNLSDTISVIATATDRVVATIPGEKYPNDVIAVP